MSCEKRKPTPSDWSRIWFGKLAQFHEIYDASGWRFSTEQVVAFLQSKRDAGEPAWKRFRIVESLILYRNAEWQTMTPFLEPIRNKLREIAQQEAQRNEGGPPIEELVGRINPREPDVIQQMRRKMRMLGKKLNTERAYVKWVKRFMREYCLTCEQDFERVGSAEVETFLTDLAVDGDCAPSTKEQAFFGLKMLFEAVLERPLQNINATRADKPSLIPTVMSEAEVKRVLEAMHGIYGVIAQL
ncbi:MAG: phage integrase N-terminal SAM-like domain-containing protein, partial [bacterium]|nr:phage integrase N-terminal SAM-like domain-containing protein [bacterium]